MPKFKVVREFLYRGSLIQEIITTAQSHTEAVEYQQFQILRQTDGQLELLGPFLTEALARQKADEFPDATL